MSLDVHEENQFSSANYDTYAEYSVIDSSACSAASLAAVLSFYGIPSNISEALRRIRATGDDVTPASGLLNLLGQGEALAAALDSAGIPSSTHPWNDLTRASFSEVLKSNRPIICQMKAYLGKYGHFLVVDGLLANGLGIKVADSNAGSGKHFSYDWGTFWAEMAGGVAIWPDAKPVEIVPPSGLNSEGEDMGRIAELEAEVADLTSKRDSLIGAVAYLADTLADRVKGIATTAITDEAVAIADEAQRVRTQFAGPRPS